MCWPTHADVPQWARDSGMTGLCLPMVDGRDQPDPFFQGFFAATSLAFDRLFGGLLGEWWFEDAIWTSPPPEEI